MDANTAKPIGRRHVCLILLFVLGIVLVFAPCWTASTFIGHEDSVLRIPLLSHWRNIPTVFSQEFMIFSDGLYRPFSYALIALLRTWVPAGCTVFWHSLLIGLHTLNVLMVFLIAKRLLRHAGAAGLAAAIFGFHPLVSEVANRVNNLYLLLGVTFYLAAFLFWLLFRAGRGPGFFAGAMVLFAAGLLTGSAVVTLPLVLLAYEVFYERSRPPALLGRLAPSFLLAAAAICLWGRSHPHPLLYDYAAAKGGEWPSFYSVVAGAGWYAQGLLLGKGVPVVLDDVVTRVHTWGTIRFVLWAGAVLATVAVAFWRMARRDPLGLGLLLIPLSLLPFATTAWNPVKDYVSWVYLYLPLVGLALVVGAAADRLLASTDARLRRAAWAGLLLVGLYGVELMRIDVATRLPVSYWRYVLSLAPRSMTAQVALGKAYVAQGDVDRALRYLFTPDTYVLGESCDAMCRYYLAQGDALAAAIHASITEDSVTLAASFEALDIPDHAESSLGRALAQNPFDTEAMKRLARILLRKGYVGGARRWLARALEIDPRDQDARVLMAAVGDEPAPAVAARPVRADTLRFLLDEKSSVRLIDELQHLRETRSGDPVIGMRAAYSLLEHERLVPATNQLARLHRRLPSFPPLTAVLAYALMSAGDLDSGESVVRRALTQNPTHPGLHYMLGYILSKQRRYREALAHLHASLSEAPDFAPTYFHIGRILANLGRFRDAITHFKRVLQDRPDLLRVHIAMALAHTELGEYDQARRHFSVAARIEPDNPRTHHDWALCCFRAGDFREAWRHVHECRRLKGEFAPGFLEALRASMPDPEK